MGTSAAALSLSIASKMACVGPLGESVRAACLVLGMTEQAACEVELSVVEAVNNAIEHAYDLAEDGIVEVRLHHQGELVRVEVGDRGRKMPPGALAQVRPPEVDASKPASLPEGRMGLFILTQLMDAVSYQSVADRNVLIMERRIDRAGGLDGSQPGCGRP